MYPSAVKREEQISGFDASLKDADFTRPSQHPRNTELTQNINSYLLLLWGEGLRMRGNGA